VASLASAIGAAEADLLGRLVAAAGAPEATIAELQAALLPPLAAAERDALVDVYAHVGRAAPWLDVSIDVVEYRGLEYHSGVTFSLYAKRVRGELARGGRYLVGDGEPATGMTLIMDTVLECLPRRPGKRRVLVPLDAAADASLRLRRNDWITVHAVAEAADIDAEAARLKCGFVLDGDDVRAIRPQPANRIRTA
jgi:ATP phosphoribosyltransferase regulatory subunit